MTDIDTLLSRAQKYEEVTADLREPPELVLIAAVDNKQAIGLKGSMPWPRLSKDMARYKRLTSDTQEKGAINVTIYGYVTYMSIPESVRLGMHDRMVIVLTQNEDKQKLIEIEGRVKSERAKEKGYINPNTLRWAHGFNSALAIADDPQLKVARIFVCGGVRIYYEAMCHPRCTMLYLTQIDGEYPADRWFNSAYQEMFKLTEAAENEQVHEQEGVKFKFQTWVKHV